MTSATGRIWLDRNLGASRVAESSTDSAAYGDLYQWGRLTDGHQERSSSATDELSPGDVPGHGYFIVVFPAVLPFDWTDSPNDNLWQPGSGTNNPCPSGFRLPTVPEFQQEIDSWGVDDNATGAFDSPLKLVMAGSRSPSDGEFYNTGSLGYYWSSTISGDSARSLKFDSNIVGFYTYFRASGYSVRCIKD